MAQWNDCLIGFGANLGDLKASLSYVEESLSNASFVRDFQSSQPIFTQPVGGSDQPRYLNAVFRLQTNLNPFQLHQQLAQLEQEAGRKREGRWQPRTLDLDLLLYGTQQIHTPSLIVPHPRMTVRRFVLEPAAEIAAEMVHPGIQRTLGQILDCLNHRPNQLVWVTDLQDASHIAEQALQQVQGLQEQPSPASPGPAILGPAIPGPAIPGPAILGSTQWSIELASDNATLAALSSTAKIVAWSNPRPPGMEMAVFTGPQIELSQLNDSHAVPVDDPVPSQPGIAEIRADEIRAELMAAMQAAQG